MIPLSWPELLILMGIFACSVLVPGVVALVVVPVLGLGANTNVRKRPSSSSEPPSPSTAHGCWRGDTLMTRCFYHGGL